MKQKIKNAIAKINLFKRIKNTEENVVIIANAHNKLNKKVEERLQMLEDHLQITLTETQKKGVHYRKKYGSSKK